MGEQLSVAQYAAKIGRTRQCVLYKIKNKRLAKGWVATKIGKAYVLTFIGKPAS
jgi:hypothetical protein